MSDDASAPGGHPAPVAYLKTNISNPMPVQTTASPPKQPTPTPTHTEPPSVVVPSPGHKGLSPGAVAGLSIGLVLGALILAVLTFLRYRSKHWHRPSPSKGGTSLGKPPVEDQRETEKPPLVHVARTPHFGPCSKLARPGWTVDRDASPFGPSATPKPLAAPSRPKRRPDSSLVASEVLNPSEETFLRSPRRPCAIASAGSIQIPQPLRAYRPPTPYYANFKTYRPGQGIDPLTLSKLEGSDLKRDSTYEVMEV